MTVKRQIQELKRIKGISQELFKRHLEIALRACPSQRSINMIKKEFPEVQ